MKTDVSTVLTSLLYKPYNLVSTISLRFWKRLKKWYTELNVSSIFFAAIPWSSFPLFCYYWITIGLLVLRPGWHQIIHWHHTLPRNKWDIPLSVFFHYYIYCSKFSSICPCKWSVSLAVHSRGRPQLFALLW